MRTFDQWMQEYGVSHQNPTNQVIHKIFVPFIMLTVVGLIWAIPTPDAFASVPYLNWATIFVACCLVFYATLNFMMFLGMLVQTFVMIFLVHKIDQTGYLISFSITVFVISWVAQFWGHKIEGKKPSFIQDLAFLLIGPLWVQRFLYRKIGLNV